MNSYDAVASLPLTVEDSTYTTNSMQTAADFDRRTTTVALHGAGHTGRGEDVTYDPDAQDVWTTTNTIDAALTGEWRLDEFCSSLDSISLSTPEDPPSDGTRRYRRWTLESAALDLALKQASETLGTLLDWSTDPVRFVVSTRLPAGDTTRVHTLLDRCADTEFKLDATSDWTAEVTADLARTDAVRIIDLKGQYSDPDLRQPADADLYDRILSAFPDAVIEDPAVTDDVHSLLADESERVAWDAPITDVESINERPWDPNWVNVKPSRIGSIETVFDIIDYADANDITLYGGGQFELGIGRTQIQHLAAICYPTSPNDVAPTVYHAPDPPRDPPTSPLTPPTTPGFGW